MNGIYIHIPFCKSKCNYCNFVSDTYNHIDEYFKQLNNEINSRPMYFNDIHTIYIGGGTPSSVPTHHLRDIMHSLNSIYNMSTLEEFTVEMNPDTVNEENLKAYIDMGVNRISIGIQSFDDKILDYLGRIHSVETAINAVLMADKYCNNISIDIIYCIPSHRQTFDLISKLPIKHVSAYILQIEEGSVFGSMGIEDTYLDHEEYMDMLSILNDNKLNRYEVSNFSLNDYQSKHNSIYWNRSDKYIGYGVSAASFDGKTRYNNNDDYSTYLTNPLLSSAESLTGEQDILEEFMLGLRTLNGLNTDIYNITDKELLNDLNNRGLIELLPDRIIVSDEGFLLLNGIISILYESYMKQIRA